jgi:hypothetical protein
MLPLIQPPKLWTGRGSLKARNDDRHIGIFPKYINALPNDLALTSQSRDPYCERVCLRWPAACIDQLMPCMAATPEYSELSTPLDSPTIRQLHDAPERKEHNEIGEHGKLPQLVDTTSFQQPA